MTRKNSAIKPMESSYWDIANLLPRRAPRGAYFLDVTRTWRQYHSGGYSASAAVALTGENKVTRIWRQCHLGKCLASLASYKNLTTMPFRRIPRITHWLQEFDDNRIWRQCHSGGYLNQQPRLSLKQIRKLLHIVLIFIMRGNFFHAHLLSHFFKPTFPFESSSKLSAGAVFTWYHICYYHHQ